MDEERRKLFEQIDAIQAVLPHQRELEVIEVLELQELFDALAQRLIEFIKLSRFPDAVKYEYAETTAKALADFFAVCRASGSLVKLSAWAGSRQATFPVLCTVPPETALVKEHLRLNLDLAALQYRSAPV